MGLGETLLGSILAMKFNPFRPNGIVPPGAFAGRYDELGCLERILHQTKHGNPEHFLITGERGIGKSSLLFFMQCIAEGSITTLDDQKFNFLVVSVELDDNTTYTSLVTKVGSELKREIEKHEKVKEAAKAVWEFLSRWEVLGVKYNGKDDKGETPDQLLEELCFTIERTVKSIQSEKDGILILIDEADKPSAKTHLGAFSKLLTERLIKQRCNNVAVGLAGLPRVIDNLRKSHESSVRIFRPITLEV
jgi:Cdc6-like AAA superfamily ATPase